MNSMLNAAVGLSTWIVRHRVWVMAVVTLLALLTTGSYAMAGGDSGGG